LHPSSGAQLQRTAIGFVWFGVFIPLEQVLVLGQFDIRIFFGKFLYMKGGGATSLCPG
jgi:hypothetical protein